MINGLTDKASFIVPVGNFPQGMAYDVADGGMYVADYSDNNVGIIFGP